MVEIATTLHLSMVIHHLEMAKLAQKAKATGKAPEIVSTAMTSSSAAYTMTAAHFTYAQGEAGRLAKSFVEKVRTI